MPRRIRRNNFFTLNGLTFSINMHDHLDGNPAFTLDDENLKEICRAISTAYQEAERDPPAISWSILGVRCRIFAIASDHRLFRYLDQRSRDTDSSWLIFTRNGNGIEVVHFGPFGKVKDKDNKDKPREETNRDLDKYRQQLKELNSPDNNMSEKEKEQEEARINNEILTTFLKMVQRIESQIESKKKELERLIDLVYQDNDKEAAKDLKEKLFASTGKMLIKTGVMQKVAAKLVAEVAAKLVAKAGLKAAGKVAGKTAAKKIPFIGLVVGAGLGIWRLTKGDAAGAALEVASGAASCVPGAGTAASLAIDASLLGKDVYEAKFKAEELQRMVTQFEKELNDLFEQYNKAEEDYEFAKEVLEDPRFRIWCVQNKISSLEVILAVVS